MRVRSGRVAVEDAQHAENTLRPGDRGGEQRARDVVGGSGDVGRRARVVTEIGHRERLPLIATQPAIPRVTGSRNPGDRGGADAGRRPVDQLTLLLVELGEGARGAVERGADVVE